MQDKTGRELSSQEIFAKSLNRVNTVLLEFWVMVLHFVGLLPCHFVRRFFYRISGMRIGKGSSIHTGARFYNPRNISIGEDSIIGEDAVLDGRSELVIGSHVDIASEVMIYNCEHDIQSQDFKPACGAVKIEDYVFVGPRAIIMPGVIIRKGAVVGAGAVVTKDVEEMSIVGGVPAKHIGNREIKDLNYRLGRAAWFR